MGGKMWTLVFLFSLSFILGSYSKPSTKKNVYIDQGWKPISREEVFNKIERRFSYVPLEGNLSFKPTIELNNTASMLVYLNNEYDEKVSKENVSNSPKLTGILINSAKEYEPKEKSAYLSTNDSNLKKSNTVFNKSERKPKKISEGIMKEATNNILYKQGLVNYQKRLHEDKDLQNKYEVTEALESTPDPKYGYVYNPAALKPSSTTNNNLTSHLFNILSKYNIQGDEDLPNYALSTRKIRLFTPSNIDARLPLTHSQNFNSLKNLTADPMLAVCLSNYGYYLPGVYGFRNNYRNLYGNLASNNLHNNKPFGYYKIISDRDSYV